MDFIRIRVRERHRQAHMTIPICSDNELCRILLLYRIILVQRWSHDPIAFFYSQLSKLH